MDGEDSVIVRVRPTRVNECPCGCEVGGGSDTGCHCVVEVNILVLFQDGSRESEFGSEGEAIMGGLFLGICAAFGYQEVSGMLFYDMTSYFVEEYPYKYFFPT